MSSSLEKVKIVVLGASGDLSMRVLFPSLSQLSVKNLEIIGYGRSRLEENFPKIISEFHTYSTEFLTKVRYVSGQYDDLSKLEGLVAPDTIYYLSVPPSVYVESIREIIRIGGLMILIEKPYAESLEKMDELRSIAADNNHVKFILVDHYIYKPQTMALGRIFGIDESLKTFLSCQFITSVDVIFKETLGLEGRKYFNSVGILKDVIQNHAAEMMGAVATVGEMSHTDFYRSAKPIDVRDCVFGQYAGYVKELGAPSNTETLGIVPVEFDSERWRGVKFVIIAGKGLDEKLIEVRCNIKPYAYKDIYLLLKDRSARNNHLDIPLNFKSIRSSSLVFNWYPHNGIFLEVKYNRQKVVYTLYDSSDINEVARSMGCIFSGHKELLDSLINKRDTKSVGIEEGYSLFKLFDLRIVRSSSMVLYPKGSSPSQSLNGIIS